MWSDLKSIADPCAVPKAKLRELGIFGGGQGVWVDATRTKQVSGDEYGVTVAVLHTGRHYPDDLGEDAVLYHYPRTGRPEARNRSEIEATKNAARLGIPLFVLIDRKRGVPTREIRLGWIEDWDDNSELFLISFGEKQPGLFPLPAADEPFFPFQERKKAFQQSVQRPNAQRFRFAVFKRYGVQCAVCSIAISELLDATHLVPWSEGGTDDPRNGLPLCVLHHKALDAGLLAIEPDVGRIVLRPGFTKQDLMVLHDDLSALQERAHQAAIEYAWLRFQSKSK